LSAGGSQLEKATPSGLLSPIVPNFDKILVNPLETVNELFKKCRVLSAFVRFSGLTFLKLLGIWGFEAPKPLVTISSIIN
jgi:hypothetical protein